MKMPQWSGRERTLAVAAAAALGLWLLVAVVILPLWDRLPELRDRAALAQEKIQRLRELSGRRSAGGPQAVDSLWRSEQSPELLQRDFLEEIEQWARSDEIQINLRPKPLARGKDTVRLGLELDIESTQEALLAFLDQLLSQPALLEIDRLKIGLSASKERPLRTTALVNKVVLHP